MLRQLGQTSFAGEKWCDLPSSLDVILRVADCPLATTD
jgi:hypothetical protein